MPSSAARPRWYVEAGQLELEAVHGVAVALGAFEEIAVDRGNLLDVALARRLWNDEDGRLMGAVLDEDFRAAFRVAAASGGGPAQIVKFVAAWVGGGR